MKKIVLFLCFYVLFSLSIVHGAWYGNTPISYTNGATQCPADGNTFGWYASWYSTDWAVTNSAASLTPTPVLNSYSLNSNLTNAINVASSWTMYCLKWDWALPSNPTSLTLSNVKNSDTSNCSYLSGNYYCKTSSASLTYNWAGASDAGWSWLKDYQIVFQRASDGAWVYYTQVTGSAASVSVSSLAQWTYYTWVRSRDNALNEASVHFQGPSLVIDTTVPTVTDNYIYDNIWTNGASKTITLSPADTGGSWLATTKWCEWVSCNPSTWTVWISITKFADYNNTIRYQSWDIAGNASVIWEVIVRLDNTSPTISDIVNTVSLNQLANNNYNYNFSVWVNWWSPITTINGNKENSVNESTTAFSCTSSPCNVAWDISKVDNYRLANGSRQYSLNVTNICDQAWNCWNGTQTYNHNVFANTLSITKTINTSALTSSYVADGTQRNISITLVDNYANAIVPATLIGRTVDFNWTVTNNMNLNQRSRTGNSVYVNDTITPTAYSNKFPLWANTTAFNSETSTNGIYTYWFKFYTPTSNQTTWVISDIAANFVINNLNFDINRVTMVSSWDNPQNQSLLWSSVNAIFNPSFKADFSSTSELKMYWFVEWSVQSNNISLTQVSSRPVWTFTTPRVYLEFWKWSPQVIFTNLSLAYWVTSALWKSPYVPSSSFVSSDWYLDSFASNSLFTKLIQTQAVSWLQDAYLSTHVSYSITEDGSTKNIVYNSDIVWKLNYWYNWVTNNTVQSWLKVVWITSSQDTNEITTNQFTNDVSILWDIYKASLKKDIIEWAYSFVKWVAVTNWLLQIRDLQNFSNNNASNGNGGVKLDNNTVLYFWSNGTNYKVDLGDNSEIVSWKKTIVIIWWNLYISNNITYNNKTTDNLWIIVLKDGNGNGWNIFINPWVTRIEATIFAEKSLLSSSDWINAHDGNTSQSVLKNQLSIYGSVFSENTIGGSRNSPVMCPYYEVCSPTDLILAQKYDLNYLRRYFVYDYNGNASIDDSDIAANGWVNYAGTFNTTIYPYARYPVVIEYNPMISTNPPPLFTK